MEDKIDVLGQLAQDIHNENVEAGWWDDFPRKSDRHTTAMMLVVTELAEAAEGVRTDAWDDHLPKFKMFDVELADAAIRLLDLAGAYLIDRLDERVGYHMNRPFSDMQRMDNDLQRLWEVVQATGRSYYREEQVVYTLSAVFALAECREVNLMYLINAKREYNKHRKDHTREARAAQGGKKW